MIETGEMPVLLYNYHEFNFVENIENSRGSQRVQRSYKNI